MKSFQQIVLLLVATATRASGFVFIITPRQFPNIFSCSNKSPEPISVFKTTTTTTTTNNNNSKKKASKQDDILPPYPSSSRNTISWKNYKRDSFVNTIDRSGFVHQSFMFARSAFVSISAAATVADVSAAVAADDNIDDYQIFKTDSGLKYIELEQGISSKTPRYGQVCVFSYTGYMQLPNDDTKKKFASQSGFVHKHGNGKLIAGLDEGLHTMKQGGRRRLVIPPKLGYVNVGLGPIPPNPIQRATLNNLLTRMVEQRGGNLIVDITLERFFNDEADQGYYEDDEASPGELAELNRRLSIKNNNIGTQVLGAVGDDIDVNNRPGEKPIV